MARISAKFNHKNVLKTVYNMISLIYDGLLFQLQEWCFKAVYELDRIFVSPKGGILIHIVLSN